MIAPLILLIAAFPGLSCGGVAARLATTEKELVKCVALWRQMGLTFGNPNSVPVLQDEGYGGEGQGHERYIVGFCEKTKAGTNYIFGSEKYRFKPWRPLPNVADWSLKTAEAARETHWHEEVFPEDSNLCAAIYAYPLGHRQFVQCLAGEADVLTVYRVHPWDWLGVPKNSSLIAQTAYQIETHYANELLKPSSSRKKILRVLEKLDALDLIHGAKGLRGAMTGLHALAQRLRSTVEWESRKRKAGDKVVTALLEDNYQTSGGNHQRYDPVYEALRSKGLAIFPVLLAHVDDDLLTRSGQRFGSGYIFSVGDVCKELIGDISGYKLYRFSTKKDKDDAMKWYREETKPH